MTPKAKTAAISSVQTVPTSARTGVAARQNSGRPNYQDENGWKYPENYQLQDELINGEQRGTDQGALRQIAAGHQHGVAALLEDSGQTVLIERAAELGFPVFDLGTKVFAKFRDDIFLLRPGKPESNSV
jgi:hypothetical protein